MDLWDNAKILTSASIFKLPTSQMAQWVKTPAAMQETWEMPIWFLGWGHLLEREMATHSSIPARKISWTEEPGGLQSKGSQEWDTTKTRQEEKGTREDETVGWHHRLNGPEFGWTPGDGDGQGGLVCCSPWDHKESDTTERLNWTDWTEAHKPKHQQHGDF